MTGYRFGRYLNLFQQHFRVLVFITVLRINKNCNLKSIIGFWLGHWLDELKIFVLTEIKKDEKYIGI